MTASAYFSIALLAVNLLFGTGMQLLWKVMSTLQYVALLTYWKIDFTNTALIAINATRNLAFLEFLKKSVLKILQPVTEGKESEVRMTVVIQNVCLMSEASVEILYVGCILVALCFVIVLFLGGKWIARLQKLSLRIRKMILWNGLIRFALQCTLKL